MEPRPPARRDATSFSPPAAAPNGHGPAADSGHQQPTAQFDPYTAPEADPGYDAQPGYPGQPGQIPQPGYGPPPGYGPTAGYPGDSSSRLGPLADEPVFYPNPGLPPNRPAYQPAGRYDARSEYALHPVGRVPPDHQPLNLRPAPPPVPPVMAPPDRSNLIKGILAGVIGLVAVAALVFAFLTFANGGFGDDDAPPPTAAAQVAGQPSGAAGVAGAASPSVAPSAAPSAPAVSGTGVTPPAQSAAPGAASDGAVTSAAPGASAEPSGGADEPESSDAGGGIPASDEEDAESSPEPSGTADEEAGATGTGDIANFLPAADTLPAGFDAPTDEGDRTLTEVAGTFVGEGEDATQAQADLEEWGWTDNQYVAYDAAPQPPDEEINRYAVSVHAFETEDGASDALPAFVDAFGVPPVDLPAAQQVGDEIVAIQTTSDAGNLVVLYVRSGAFILKIDAASVAGDPLPAALELAGQLVG